MPQAARLAVVGSVNTDLVVYAPRLPRPGETALGGDLHRYDGGKGANQAVAAARLGASVHMVGRVGDDEFGRANVASLAARGVDVAELRSTPGVPSGVALIVVGREGENLIALAPGANARVTPEDVERAWPAVAGSAVMLLQMEVPVAATERAARLAREDGMLVALNPAPAPTEPLPRTLLGCLDLIVPNESEAEALTGQAVSDLASAEQAARRLVAMGPRAAVVTLGARGALVFDGAEAWHVPPVPVEAVDTTAAGDAFCGALAVALAGGQPLAGAARFAAGAAALSVTRRGAQDSMPSADEVAALMAGGAA